MSRWSPYPQELRERAVRMGAEVRPHVRPMWVRSARSRSKLGAAVQRGQRAARRSADADPCAQINQVCATSVSHTGRPDRRQIEGGYRTSVLPRPSQGVTVIAAAGSA